MRPIPPRTTGPAAETRIYLLRHARPLLPDDQPRFIGAGSDPPLAPEGIAQAQRMSDRLDRVTFSAAWSSGLARSAQTAAIVSGLPPHAVRTEQGLREIELGLWEGLTAEEAARLYPREWAQREADVVDFRFPGGESFRELQARVVPSFLQVARITLDEGASDALVVAHKNAVRVLLCSFRALPLEEMFSISQDYCSLTVLTVRPADGDGLHIDELGTIP